MVVRFAHVPCIWYIEHKPGIKTPVTYGCCHVYEQIAGMGGATISIADKAVIKDCLARNNGAGVHVNESSKLEASGDIQITGNSAGSKGGCLYAEGDATDVSFAGSCKLQNVRICARN
jgi:predicted outer membrane repeat protein